MKNTIEAAIITEKPPQSLILHSDGGGQYRSWNYYFQVTKNEIMPSMSKPATPGANAMAENFFSTFKVEYIYLEKPKTLAEAEKLTDEFVDYYNYERLQGNGLTWRAILKKLLIFLLLGALVTILSSCSLGWGHIGGAIFNDDFQNADKRFEQLLNALINKDKDAIQSMFSKRALAETEDFDGSIEYLFSLFEGEVQQPYTGSSSVGNRSDKGRKSKEIRMFYNVNTEYHEYLFFLLDYPIDTFDPDNVGLYSLRVIKEEDSETQFGYWQDMTIPGIYIPTD